MKSEQFSSYGLRAALAEIERRSFTDAEDRLREKMKPARLAPLQNAPGSKIINFSHVNGRAASDSLISQMRKTAPLPIPPSGFIAENAGK